MIFKVFFLISVVCLSQAFAGYEVGNGGSVVVCRDALNNILSVELLDIYEQRVKSKLSIKEFEEKYSESVNWYDLISATSPRRGKLYGLYLQNFEKEAVYVQNDIPLSNDFGDVVDLPQSCKIEQLVLQVAKAHPFDLVVWKGRYKINQYLWNSLSDLNKRATVLHEIIYRERISQCIQFNEGKCYPYLFNLNSKNIRILVGLYVTGVLEHSTTQFINQLYLDAGLKRIESQGIVFVEKVPDYLTVNFEFENSNIVSLNVEEFFRNKTNTQNQGQFIVNDFFDALYMGSKYYSFIKLKYKDYELILPNNFIFKFYKKKIVISPFVDNELFPVRMRYKSNNYKSFLMVKQINIISDSSVEMILDNNEKVKN